MATHHNTSLNGLIDDYAQLRAVPALLGVFYLAASLFQFGGLSTPEILWFGGYELTTTHAMMGSLGVLVIAFASSETKDFERYEQWEQGLIAAAPVLILGYHYVGFVETLVNTAEPWGQIAAFVICAAGYAVAIR
ncbi:hypothetical protein [Natronosalvus vescus]|uniref:hypothetical protein n=1 Tax=Natronosalvus vescus TaxID=2953881 RepID=UPI0020900BCC|nr:hypothetical protein [Natronosalvus vescus]